MRHGMILFITVFTLIQALWCFYVGRRLFTPDLPQHWRPWLWAVLILLFLFQWLIPGLIVNVAYFRHQLEAV